LIAAGESATVGALKQIRAVIAAKRNVITEPTA
jgi:hypothetical protein